MDDVPHNEDGAGGAHLYMPWWLDNKKLDFPRGYHIELGGGRGMPGSGFGGDIQRIHRHDGGRRVGGYGKQLKDDYRRFYGATVGFAGRGEMIPNEDSYCEIDPDGGRRWGIPVLRFHWKWSDHELQAGEAHAGDLPRDHPRDGRHADDARCRPREQRLRHRHRAAASSTSWASRAWATIRRPSVLNSNCQAHDVKNLFVTDGGPFVTQADKNVTWTILALAMRTSEYIADQRKAGS